MRITKTLRWGADTFFFSKIRQSRYSFRDCRCCARHGWCNAIPFTGASANARRPRLDPYIDGRGGKWVFYIFFFLLYLISSKTAHRLVGYFEEEAVLSYTLYLAEIDEGRHPNPPAPPVALRYWNLPEGTTLRDVILIIRADEAHPRDTNHYMANALSGRDADHEAITASPPHVSLDAGLL